ncbi:RNA-binding protein [Xylophilus sp. Kf1]|nr:RNA-binding protein [Xylophilus sp. Kf1]
MSGTFYPTGHVVILFPEQADAERTAESLLSEGNFTAEQVASLSPATVLREVAPPDDGADTALPSVGFEGVTATAFEEHARNGHHGLVVAADTREDAERVMVIARRVPFSLAKRYRTLVIEDLD